MSDLAHNSNEVPSVPTALNAIYVAKYGNDSNKGLSEESPKLTIGAAITAANALIPSASNRIEIHVLDSGTYTEDVVLPAFLDLDAPCVTLESVGGTALDMGEDSSVQLLSIDVSTGGIGLKYESSSTNKGFVKIKSIIAGDTSEAAVLLGGRASIEINSIKVGSGTGVRLSPILAPFPAINEHSIKFDEIELTGAGTALQLNGTNDDCLVMGISIKSVVAGANAIHVNNGKIEFTGCIVDLNGGFVWDVEPAGELNFICGNVVRQNTSGEFITKGNVSSFVSSEEVKRFKIQTISTADVEVYRVPLAEGDMYGFTVEAVGFRDTEDSASYQNVQNAFFRDTGGLTQRVGTQDGDGIRTTTDPNYKIQFTVDGNDAVISARGSLLDTVNWDIKIREARKDG